MNEKTLTLKGDLTLSDNQSLEEINISKIDKYAKDKETIVVPGAVLGNGNITKKVKVAALRFSQSAKEKLLNAGCEVLTLEELLVENPEGKNTRIMG